MMIDTAGTLEVLADGGAFFESPRWHEGRWWVSDMFGGRVLGLAPNGEITDVHRVEDRPSGIGWLPDGRMLVVLMESQRLVTPNRDGDLESYAELSDLFRGPANDLLVDRAGRAWVGSLGFDMAGGATPAPTSLVCILPDGSRHTAADGLITPNGAGMLADGQTLVVAETLASRLTAFRIGPDGRLGAPEVWAQLAPAPPLDDLRTALRALKVAPDGLTVDSEDCVWVADAAGGDCIRVAHGGEIRERVSTPPGLSAFACALGGPEGRTLMLCCSPDAVPSRRVVARESVLLTVDIAVPGGDKFH